MPSKDSIEAAYCFFHQKWRVYEFSNMEWQKEDIEYAIAQYVDDRPHDVRSRHTGSRGTAIGDDA